MPLLCIHGEGERASTGAGAFFVGCTWGPLTLGAQLVDWEQWAAKSADIKPLKGETPPVSAAEFFSERKF